MKAIRLSFFLAAKGGGPKLPHGINGKAKR
jgi:hypothetical protein